MKSLVNVGCFIFSLTAFIFKNPVNTCAACNICIVSDEQRSTKGETSRWAMWKKQQEGATRWVWVEDTQREPVIRTGCFAHAAGASGASWQRRRMSVLTCRCSQLLQLWGGGEASYLLCFSCARTELRRCSRASAGPTAIQQKNQSLCKRDEWDAAVLIRLHQRPTVGSPSVFFISFQFNSRHLWRAAAILWLPVSDQFWWTGNRLQLCFFSFQSLCTG